MGGVPTYEESKGCLFFRRAKIDKIDSLLENLGAVSFFVYSGTNFDIGFVT